MLDGRDPAVGGIDRDIPVVIVDVIGIEGFAGTRGLIENGVVSPSMVVLSESLVCARVRGAGFGWGSPSVVMQYVVQWDSLGAAEGCAGVVGGGDGGGVVDVVG
jgi:hypothetical protein